MAWRGVPFEDTWIPVVKLELLWFYAARYGSLGWIEWAHQCGFSRLWEEYRFEWEVQRIPIGKPMCAKAARYGKLDALQLLRQHGCPWSSWTCRDAAEGGHLAVLQWARENGCPWNEMTCAAAAKGGHLSCLQWARKNGCDWDKTTLLRYAKNCGKPDVLSYIIDN